MDFFSITAVEERDSIDNLLAPITPLDLPPLSPQTVEQWRRETSAWKAEKARRRKARDWQTRRPRTPKSKRGCPGGGHTGSTPPHTIVTKKTNTPHFDLESLCEQVEGAEVGIALRLVQPLEGIVRAIAGVYGFNVADGERDSPDLEDMRSYCLLRLWQARHRFDGQRQGVMEFAAREIRSACFRWLEQNRITPRTDKLERWAGEFIASVLPVPMLEREGYGSTRQSQLHAFIPKGWYRAIPSPDPSGAWSDSDDAGDTTGRLTLLCAGTPGECAVEGAELRIALRQQWRALRDDERNVAALSMQGLTDRQIGERMGRTERGTESLRLRTKGKVMTALDGGS